MTIKIVATAVAGLTFGCSSISSAIPNHIPTTKAAQEPAASMSVAVFAGGCFWCMEGPFEAMNGVKSVESGYTGGVIEGPSYRQVAGKQTDHVEAVRVEYNADVVSYAELLAVFWKNIDPTQDNGQFCDLGPQYASAIFTQDETEKKLALKTKDEVEKKLGKGVATTIRDAKTFWLAEEYHQDYYKKNPVRYKRYRQGCKRDKQLQDVWGL